MGWGQSKEEPPAPKGPPALLPKPWRSDIIWTPRYKQELVEDFNSFKVKGGVKYLNCMLLGQTGSGKSSFINTCATALKDIGRILIPSTVQKSSESSVTTKFETHRLYKKRDKALKLRIFDCRGLHDISGVTMEDIRLIVHGHIKGGYTINSANSISRRDPHYRKKPKLKHMMHCVVYVVNGENPSGALVGEAAEEIFKNIRSELEKEHIPQVVLMTKVDSLRASLADDLSDLYRSVEVQWKLEHVANFTAIPEMNVLPMSNYHNETEPNTNKDVLALTNLKTIRDRANDFVQYTRDKKKSFFR